MPSINNNFIAWIILITLAVVWGSSFILIKYAVVPFTPSQVGSMRIFIAFLFLLPFALAKLKFLYRKDLLWLFLSGVVGNLIPSLLFAYAGTRVESSIIGVLNSLTPVFTLVIAMVIFAKRYKALNITGVFVGMAGAILLMISMNDGVFDIKLGYASLVVIATICYAINLNILKNKLDHIHPVNIASFSFLLAGPVAGIHLIIFTPLTDNMQHPDAASGFLFVMILAILGSAIAIMMLNHLVKITNAVFSSSVTYLIPIVAIIAGIVDGEVFKSVYVIWVIIILSGVLMVNYKKQR